MLLSRTLGISGGRMKDSCSKSSDGVADMDPQGGVLEMKNDGAGETWPDRGPEILAEEPVNHGAFVHHLPLDFGHAKGPAPGSPGFPGPAGPAPPPPPSPQRIGSGPKAMTVRPQALFLRNSLRFLPVPISLQFKE